MACSPFPLVEITILRQGYKLLRAPYVREQSVTYSSRVHEQSVTGSSRIREQSVTGSP